MRLPSRLALRSPLFAQQAGKVATPTKPPLNLLPYLACLNTRDLKTHIGDQVHFDTDAQNQIGKRFAVKLMELSKP